MNFTEIIKILLSKPQLRDNLLMMFLSQVCQEKQISFCSKLPSWNLLEAKQMQTGYKILCHWHEHNIHNSFFKRVQQEYRKAFLNYTKLYPDHWICPENIESGFWDLPHNSAIFLSYLLLKKTNDLVTQEFVLPYAEFLGAMQSATEYNEIPFALVFIFLAYEKYPDISMLEDMINRYIQIIRIK